jgi:hypothetical protein
MYLASIEEPGEGGCKPRHPQRHHEGLHAWTLAIEGLPPPMAISALPSPLKSPVIIAILVANISRMMAVTS